MLLGKWRSQIKIFRVIFPTVKSLRPTSSTHFSALLRSQNGETNFAKTIDLSFFELDRQLEKTQDLYPGISTRSDSRVFYFGFFIDRSKFEYRHGMLLGLWNDKLLRRLQLLNSWTESMIFGKIGKITLNLSNYWDNLMISNNSITRPSHRFQGLNYSIRV